MLYTQNIDNNFYVLSNPYTLKNIKENKTISEIVYTEKNSYIEGQSFDKDTTTKFSNVKYIVENSNSKEILYEVESNDGSFKIENLPDDKNINLIVIDESNKYNGKYLNNIPTQPDYNKKLKIIRVYQTNNTAHIKIVFSGDPNALAIFIQNATLEKIDINNYKVIDITGSYTITLHDYVDEVLYSKEVTYT